MNTIYLVSDLRPAGPTNQAYNLITGLLKLGCNSILVTLFEESKDSWIDRFYNAGVEIVQLKADRKHLKDAARKIEEIIKARNIDIVHSSGLSADTVNRYIKVPVFKMNTIRQEFDQIAEDSNFIVRFLARIMTKQNYKAMDRRFACSQILAEDVQKSTGFKIDSVQNGVDTDRYVNVDYFEKSKIRESLGLPVDKTIYISTGVFYKRKQMYELAEMFLSLKNENSVLVLVGEGETFEEVKQLVNDTPSIILTGKKNDPLKYYQASDIFVSASLAEGLPNTVMEAMACGLPCILSDIGPHKEILDYESNAGILFRTKNYDDLRIRFEESFAWNLAERSKSAENLISKHLSKYATALNYFNAYKKISGK